MQFGRGWGCGGGGVKWSLLLQPVILLRKSKFCFGLKIKNNAFKKFTFRFGVIKIIIDSSRACERKGDHLTPPFPHSGFSYLWFLRSIRFWVLFATFKCFCLFLKISNSGSETLHLLNFDEILVGNVVAIWWWLVGISSRFQPGLALLCQSGQ